MAASMVEIPTILNASSSPVSPGQATWQQPKPALFVPPARPSSTPFPHPENRNAQVCCLAEFDASIESVISDDQIPSLHDESLPGNFQAVQFQELPIEVHEAIVDHLFGFCISPASSSAMRISSLTKTWGSALRHSRRRELANLALVNRRWTFLIQQRLYRHIKLKATVESIEDAVMHLAGREHLARHFKHVEIWFPVFQPKYSSPSGSSTFALPTVTTTGLAVNNCTLEEIFRFFALFLPEAQVLTLEGGERRKAPKAVHSADPSRTFSLCSVESVRTLVIRGQWNLTRSYDDFANILRVLPNLEEWQGSYSKPKSKSYITLSQYLPSLPAHVKRLGMCMENDYRREAFTPSFYLKVAAKTHICLSLGQVLPRLEHFSFTGRVCHRLFRMASLMSGPPKSRLKYIDLTVKNCCTCRENNGNCTATGSGIHEMNFIEAFEKLVVAAVRLLERHEDLQFLRVRFVDLDSLLPPLNPYFLLSKRRCTGVWSELIVNEMARVRPDVSFADLSESFGNIVYSKGEDGSVARKPADAHLVAENQKLPSTGQPNDNSVGQKLALAWLPWARRQFEIGKRSDATWQAPRNNGPAITEAGKGMEKAFA